MIEDWNKKVINADRYPKFPIFFYRQWTKLNAKTYAWGTCSNRVIASKENEGGKKKKKEYTNKLEQSNKRCESKLDKLTSKYIVVSLLLLLHETSLIDWAIHVVK